MLWANLHLLFWLSLVPFVTGWMGENHFAAARWPSTAWCCSWPAWPTGCCRPALLRIDGPDSVLAYAIGRDVKGLSSPPLYVAGIAASFWNPWVAGAIYVFVALMWLVPDKRIERTLAVRATTKLAE